MLSVVIPSRGEGAMLTECLRALQGVEGIDEVVVAAFGETDAVRRAVERFPCLVWLGCPCASRADQLNRGAAAAQGDVLLFLHADTRLPADSARLIAEALSTPGVVGGAHRLRFDCRHPALDLLATLSVLAWSAAFFGDQGMFCRRTTFESVGGFRSQPLFEDVDLALSLARRGALVRLVAPVITSARRFTATGPWWQLALNASLLALHFAGAPTRRLASLYRP